MHSAEERTQAELIANLRAELEGLGARIRLLGCNMLQQIDELERKDREVEELTKRSTEAEKERDRLAIENEKLRRYLEQTIRERDDAKEQIANMTTVPRTLPAEVEISQQERVGGLTLAVTGKIVAGHKDAGIIRSASSNP